MSDIGIQYGTGLSRQHIEQALIAAGKDPGRLQPADLGLLEDFHTMGRIATSQLAELGSPSGTGTTSPDRRPSSCRRCCPGPPAR